MKTKMTRDSSRLLANRQIHVSERIFFLVICICRLQSRIRSRFVSHHHHHLFNFLHSFTLGSMQKKANEQTHILI